MARDTTFLRTPILRLAAALAGLVLACVVMADDCGGNPCTKPPVEVGGLVTAAQAAAGAGVLLPDPR